MLEAIAAVGLSFCHLESSWLKIDRGLRRSVGQPIDFRNKDGEKVSEVPIWTDRADQKAVYGGWVENMTMTLDFCGCSETMETEVMTLLV